MDDLAVTVEKGAHVCLSCHMRESGYARPVPASLILLVRAVLDGIPEWQP
jgi:hypothetical protein